MTMTRMTNIAIPINERITGPTFLLRYSMPRAFGRITDTLSAVRGSAFAVCSIPVTAAGELVACMAGDGEHDTDDHDDTTEHPED